MKKTQKVPIQNLFNEDAELTEKALNSMAAAVSAFCNGKDKDQQAALSAGQELQQ